MKSLNINNRVAISVKSDEKNVGNYKIAIHPRPQLQRLPWQSLNGLWKFAFDYEGKCVQPSDLKQLTHLLEIPYAPESIKSGVRDTNFNANCWYEREFTTPDGDGRLLLHFSPVEYRARVWVND